MYIFRSEYLTRKHGPHTYTHVHTLYKLLKPCMYSKCSTLRKKRTHQTKNMYINKHDATQASMLSKNNHVLTDFNFCLSCLLENCVHGISICILEVRTHLQMLTALLRHHLVWQLSKPTYSNNWPCIPMSELGGWGWGRCCSIWNMFCHIDLDSFSHRARAITSEDFTLRKICIVSTCLWPLEDLQECNETVWFLI